MSITRDDWLKALADVGETQEDDQNAVTVNEFAIMMGLTRQTASRQLERLEKAGKAERTKKRGEAPDGRCFRYLAFKLI